MYSKLSVAFVAALAVVANAESGGPKYPHHHEHEHQHHPTGVFPSGMPYKPSGSAPAPFPTGVPTGGFFPTGTAAGTGVSGGSGPEQTGDSTLTYTIGSGDHTTVITTTIHHTNTHTDYIYAQQTGATGGGPGGNDNNSPAQGPGGNDNNAAGAQGEVSQTMYLTSTSTNYITEYAGQTGAPGAPGAPEKVADNNLPASGAGGNGGAGGCGSASTITVQGPEVTVTVTAPAVAGATDTGSGGDNSPAGPGQSGAGSQLPPYPIPSSKKHKTKCASTGFITKPHFKPTGTGGLPGPLPTGSGGMKLPVPFATGSMAPIVSATAYKN